MSKLKKYKNRKGQDVPFLYRDVNTNIFWVNVRVRGQLKKRSLETSDPVEANIRLPLKLQELQSSTERVKKVNKLVRDFYIDLVKEKKSEGMSPATLSRLDVIWRHHLEPYFGNMAPGDIRADMIPDFVDWHEKNASGQLVNVYKYLGNLFRFMHRSGAILINQVPKLVIPKSEAKHHAKKKGRVISHAEYERILAHATSEQAKLWIMIGYAIGARKMEIGALEKERVHFQGDRAIIDFDTDDTKTGLARQVPLPLDVSARLRAYLATTDSIYVFPMPTDSGRHTYGQLMDKEWVAAKQGAKIVARTKFHDLRKTAASNMARQNINVVLACTILGMSVKTYQKEYLMLTAKDLILSVDQLAAGVSQ